MNSSNRDHDHAPNRFGVIPTPLRLNANPEYTGKGVTLAFLDSGFYPHPDLITPEGRIVAYHDLAGERPSLVSTEQTETWQWHGTQTSVVAAGNGSLSDGLYRGLAHESQLVLVKVSERGRITEENIARGIRWVIENRARYDIRVLNISLGGDEDVPCSRSIIDQAAEEAIREGIVVVAAAGNSGAEGRHSIPPANSPSVITVGGYSDNNELDQSQLSLYHSNFGATADGSVKPELVAPAEWIVAPTLPSREQIVATHYQHVDGTSFAAPIVTSIVAQMIQANPSLTPGAIKNILLSTADRIVTQPVIRQGYGAVNARRALELAKTEQHALNVVGCKPPRVENGTLLFVYHDDYADSVSIAGDFNGWSHLATPLKRNSSGLWSTEIFVPRAERLEYKFVINGSRWLEDPSNGMKTPDAFGGLNSVLVVQ